MNKNIFTSFLVVFALCAGAFTVFWFYEAGKVKQQTEQQILELNILALKEAPQYITGPGLNALTYSSIEASGFPFEIELTFKELRFKSLIANMRIDGLVVSRGIFSGATVLNADNIALSVDEGVKLDPALKPGILEVLAQVSAGRSELNKALEDLLSLLRLHFKADVKE